MKNDIARSMTIEQLKQQYNLDSKKVLSAIQQERNKLTKVENEMNNYIKAVTKELSSLQDQVDGNIATWFFDGSPTLENNPAKDWVTTEEKDKHIGDLYYDKSTGYAYRFQLEGETYNWKKLTDNDITKALAIANSAKDTADSKRRTFISTPSPPYDSGDLWIKEGEIWICQISKPSGEIYANGDFINNLNYTDDTFATEVNGKLEIVSGKVVIIEKGIEEINQKIEDNKYYVDNEGNKQLISSSVSQFMQDIDSINMSISSLETSIEENNVLTNNVSSNLDNNYLTKEQTEQLILNSESGLSNIFTKIGGNNLIKNSALYFKKDNIYDYWIGSAKKIIYSNAQSNTAISLKNSSFKQSISLANNDYTLSFKYKRLNSLGSANVKINNETISLEETGEIKKTLSITTNQFEIEFNSTLDDSYIIYDLMLNVGTESSTWSQYANEIHTDTVNISKGITVEATENDTIGSLGADGLKVENKYTNETVLKATDTGMETPEIIAKTGTMGGASIKKVGNQSWIVGV
jgi:hypothetical protein